MNERTDVVMMTIMCDEGQPYSFEQWSNASDGFMVVVDGGECNHPIYEQFLWDHIYPYGAYGQSHIVIFGDEAKVHNSFNSMTFNRYLRDFAGVDFGCTDELANNYQPEATHDDGTCDYSTIYGERVGQVRLKEAGERCQRWGMDDPYQQEVVENAYPNMCLDLNMYWTNDALDIDVCGSEGCITPEIACEYWYQNCQLYECVTERVPECDDNDKLVYDCVVAAENVEGDMNQDGILNILDLVTWVDRFLSTTPDAGNQEQLFSQYPEMDINNDGIINILDLIVLVNMILENNRTNSNIISRIEKQLDRLLLMGNLSYDDIKKIEEAKKTTNLKQTFIDEILQKQKNG
ncbi:MAG: hypothetical protein CBC24_09050 [Candidatus Pelagibacter sp. TMED64]|nr:MAG: hypothetical protein CBC24_09050 [Candidatus Pelagibacter sp. TMED64]|tara:strand:- start:7179 stop:8222 length:1044 start_codon:yes stop_codon:yes gene_type:complete